MILEMFRELATNGSVTIMAITAIAITAVKTSPEWMKEHRKRTETSPNTVPPRNAQQTSSVMDRTTLRYLILLNLFGGLVGVCTLVTTAWSPIPVTSRAVVLIALNAVATYVNFGMTCVFAVLLRRSNSP
jgi:hypothetical protein